jgi:hypothetical protein
MHKLRPFSCFLVLIAALYIGPWAPAAAAGKEVPVVAALCDALEAQLGVRPTYRRVKKAKDGTITIRGLTTEVQQSQKVEKKIKGTLSIEGVTLSGVSEDASGQFDVAQVMLSNLIFISDEDAEFSSALRLPEVKITHLYLKANNAAVISAGWMLPLEMQAQRFEAEKAMLASGGLSLQIGSIAASWMIDPDTGVGRTDFKVQDIHYPASAIRRSDPTGVVLSLIGGGDLVLDLLGTTMLGSDGGVFEAALALRSLGTLQITGKLAGRLPSVLASAPTMSQSDAEMPTPAASPIMISGISLRYEDMSLTGKLLALLARDQGVATDRLIEEAATAVATGVGQDSEDELFSQITSAVRSYLSAPKSFTVASDLPQPVPIQAFIESMAQGPAEFFARYPASVSVNE